MRISFPCIPNNLSTSYVANVSANHYIFDELKRRNIFLVTAESLTGGLIAKYITDVPGASTVFWGGWVTYSVQAKQHVLNVPAEILEHLAL